MNSSEGLRSLARDLTYEYFGNELAIGKYFLYKGKPIQIIDGQFMGTYGLSNFWYWKEVLSDGNLSKEVSHGYGGGSDVFKPIGKDEAIKIAKTNE